MVGHLEGWTALRSSPRSFVVIGSRWPHLGDRQVAGADAEKDASLSFGLDLVRVPHGASRAGDGIVESLRR